MELEAEELTQAGDTESERLMDVYERLDELDASTAEAKAARILHGLGLFWKGGRVGGREGRRRGRRGRRGEVDGWEWERKKEEGLGGRERERPFQGVQSL